MIIINKNRDVFGDILAENILVDGGGGIVHDLESAMDASKLLTIKEHYCLFLHIWFRSLIEAQEHADLLLDIDKLGSSMDYANDLEKIFLDYGVSVDFHDFNQKVYDKLSLSYNNYEVETKLMYNFYTTEYSSINSSFLYYYIESRLSGLVIHPTKVQALDKINLFHRIFRRK